MRLLNEITKKLSDALIAATPKGVTTAVMCEVNLGIIWKFVFATMMIYDNARLIRETVDLAIREAIQLRGEVKPRQ